MKIVTLVVIILAVVTVLAIRMGRIDTRMDQGSNVWIKLANTKTIAVALTPTMRTDIRISKLEY